MQVRGEKGEMDYKQLKLKNSAQGMFIHACLNTEKCLNPGLVVIGPFSRYCS